MTKHSFRGENGLKEVHTDSSIIDESTTGRHNDDLNTQNRNEGISEILKGQRELENMFVKIQRQIASTSGTLQVYVIL